MIINKIRKTIIKIAESENKVLEKSQGKGIFDLMPEHAFVYQIGKQIGIDSHKIFGSNIIWKREEERIDLIIENDGKRKMIFEFKISGRFEEKDGIKGYKGDIVKLQNLSSSIEKYFCALIDVYVSAIEKDGNIKDGRIVKLKEIESKEIDRIDDFYFFPTVRINKKPMLCCIGLWKIIPIELQK